MLLHEKLEPTDLINQMEIRYNLLQCILEEKQKELSSFPADLPKGRIRIARNGHTYHYFFIPSDKKKGTYIPKKNIKFVKQLSEAEYLRRLNTRLEKQIKALKKASSVLRRNPLPQISDPRTSLFTPVFYSNEVFAKKWQLAKNPAEKRTTAYVTERGESVCSKSEVIIANTLFHKKIPYHYEMPLTLKGYGIIHPDFLCLNTRTHKEYVWEHFGMMDDASYAGKAVAKIRSYSNNGYIVGKNLIVSMESRDNPLSTAEIKKIIEAFLE